MNNISLTVLILSIEKEASDDLQISGSLAFEFLAKNEVKTGTIFYRAFGNNALHIIKHGPKTMQIACGQINIYQDEESLNPQIVLKIEQIQSLSKPANSTTSGNGYRIKSPATSGNGNGYKINPAAVANSLPKSPATSGNGYKIKSPATSGNGYKAVANSLPKSPAASNGLDSLLDKLAN